jgi:hypothetical protein
MGTVMIGKGCTRSVRRAALMFAVVAALAPAMALPAQARSAPSFGPAVTLGDGQGKPAEGGEPSIAADVTSRAGVNDLYVVSPNLHSLWYSYDSGATWSAPAVFDPNGLGGDTDVAVAQSGHVIVTDLDITHAFVQVSSDYGKTFNTGTLTGPEDDRPWVTTQGPSDVYVSYHDLALGIPVVCASTDGGMTFPFCSQAFSASASTAQCLTNTIPARALGVDPNDGTINFLYSCSTAAENVRDAPSGPLHNFYLAKATPTLPSGISYKTSTVFIASTKGGKAPDYANIFGTLAIDAAGNYYALIDGTANNNNVARNPYHVYLLTSTNGGRTWSAPKQVDHDRNGSGTHVFAHLVVTRPGNVDVVWYGSSATGDPNGVCGTAATQAPCSGDPFYSTTAGTGPGWNVYMAQTTNALAATPAWTQVMVNPQATHFGEICTNGVLCTASDRSLLDFISVAVDCHGLAHVAYASNPEEASGQQAYLQVSNQSGGTPLAPPPSCSALTGPAQPPGVTWTTPQPAAPAPAPVRLPPFMPTAVSPSVPSIPSLPSLPPVPVVGPLWRPSAVVP